MPLKKKLLRAKPQTETVDQVPQESQGGCEPVGIEEIDSARRRKVNGSQEAAENRYSIDQPCIYSLDPPGHEWIHRIECEAHSATIANVAPQISNKIGRASCREREKSR